VPSKVGCAAGAQLVVVERCSGWDDDWAGAQGESGPIQLDDGALDAVAVIEVVLAKPQLSLKIGLLQMGRPMDEEPV
jgi:hypothetical protein